MVTVLIRLTMLLAERLNNRSMEWWVTWVIGWRWAWLNRYNKSLVPIHIIRFNRHLKLRRLWQNVRVDRKLKPVVDMHSSYQSAQRDLKIITRHLTKVIFSYHSSNEQRPDKTLWDWQIIHWVIPWVFLVCTVVLAAHGIKYYHRQTEKYNSSVFHL